MACAYSDDRDLIVPKADQLVLDFEGMESVLLAEREGSVATLTMNRPQTKNALDPELLFALAKGLAEVAADRSVRAVVLTGAGDAFCAGVLYGLHEGWDLQRCLLTGVCIAAASLADATCTAGVRPLKTSLALAKKFGFGPPLGTGD